MKSLYHVFDWTKRQGQPKDESRLRIRLLGLAKTEQVDLKELQPRTPVSPEFLTRAHKIASKVVGKTCPEGS